MFIKQRIKRNPEFEVNDTWDANYVTNRFGDYSETCITIYPPTIRDKHHSALEIRLYLVSGPTISIFLLLNSHIKHVSDF